MKLHKCSSIIFLSVDECSECGPRCEDGFQQLCLLQYEGHPGLQGMKLDRPVIHVGYENEGYQVDP